MGVTVYLAQAMSGKKCLEICEQNTIATDVLTANGIVVNSPVVAEGIFPIDAPLFAKSEYELRKKWQIDKELIKRSDVLLDISGWTSSEGVKFEVGFARYALFKPVVRVHPTLGISIGRFESDDICNTIEEASNIIVKKYGTRWKRIKWRMSRNIFYKWVRLTFWQFAGLLQ